MPSHCNWVCQYNNVGKLHAQLNVVTVILTSQISSNQPYDLQLQPSETII